MVLQGCKSTLQKSRPIESGHGRHAVQVANVCSFKLGLKNDSILVQTRLVFAWTVTNRIKERRKTPKKPLCYPNNSQRTTKQPMTNGTLIQIPPGEAQQATVH